MIVSILFILFLAWILWIYPGLGTLRQAALKGGWLPGWTLALCTLSPMGWAVWTGWKNARGWMRIVSVAAAYGIFFLARALPAGEEKPAPPPRWCAALAAAVIIGYGFWTTKCAAEYTLWNQTRASSERATVGQLSSLRSSLEIYKADNEGRVPPDLQALIPKYGTEIPVSHALVSMDGIIRHAPSREVRLAAVPDDAGGWGYSAADGRVYINCTHPDLMGQKELSEY